MKEELGPASFSVKASFFRESKAIIGLIEKFEEKKVLLRTPKLYMFICNAEISDAVTLVDYLCDIQYVADDADGKNNLFGVRSSSFQPLQLFVLYSPRNWSFLLIQCFTASRRSSIHNA